MALQAVLLATATTVGVISITKRTILGFRQRRQARRVNINVKQVRIVNASELRGKDVAEPRNCDITPYESVVLDNQVAYGHVDDVFKLVTTSAHFMRSWSKFRQLKDVRLTRWGQLEDGTCQRIVQYSIPLNHPMAPKFGLTTERQQVVLREKQRGVFQIEVQAVTPNVPMGNSFKTMVKIQCQDLKKRLEYALNDLVVVQECDDACEAGGQASTPESVPPSSSALAASSRHTQRQSARMNINGEDKYISFRARSSDDGDSQASAGIFFGDAKLGILNDHETPASSQSQLMDHSDIGEIVTTFLERYSIYIQALESGTDLRGDISISDAQSVASASSSAATSDKRKGKKSKQPVMFSDILKFTPSDIEKLKHFMQSDQQLTGLVVSLRVEFMPGLTGGVLGNMIRSNAVKGAQDSYKCMITTLNEFMAQRDKWPAQDAVLENKTPRSVSKPKSATNLGEAALTLISYFSSTDGSQIDAVAGQVISSLATGAEELLSTTRDSIKRDNVFRVLKRNIQSVVTSIFVLILALIVMCTRISTGLTPVGAHCVCTDAQP